MFRRQTDEVFSTLQNVQRRISQHTEGGTQDTVLTGSVRRVGPPQGGVVKGTPSTRPPSRAPGSRPPEDRRLSNNRFSKESFRVNSTNTGQPAHVVPVVDRSSMGNTAPLLPDAGLQVAPGRPEAEPRERSPGLYLGVELGLLVAVLWIGTVIGAYFVGLQGGAPEQTTAGVTRAPGDAGARQLSELVTTAETRAGGGNTTARPTVQPLGTHVLVLESYSRYSQAGEDRFKSVAASLNDFAAKNANLGYKPWFGVRRPSSGGLQLVFGEVATEVFGIDLEADLSKVMYRDLRKERFKDAFWVRIIGEKPQ